MCHNAEIPWHLLKLANVLVIGKIGQLYVAKSSICFFQWSPQVDIPEAPHNTKVQLLNAWTKGTLLHPQARIVFSKTLSLLSYVPYLKLEGLNQSLSSCPLPHEVLADPSIHNPIYQSERSLPFWRSLT